MLKIAYRNLLTNKSRSLLAVLGLVLGVVTLIALISITTGIKGAVTESISGMKGIAVVEKDVTMTLISVISMDDIKKIEKIQGVKVVAPRVMGQITILDGYDIRGDAGFGSLTVIGIEPSKEALTRKGPLHISADITRGRALKSSDKYSMVIGKAFADDLKKGVGSKIKLNDQNFKVVGIYETGMDQSEGQVIIPIDAARELFGLSNDIARAAYVDVEDINDDKKVATRIEAKVNTVDARTTEEFAGEIAGMLASVEAFLIVMSVIATGVAGLGIINTMLMSVFERTHEFGSMRAIGWTQEDLMKLVITESVLLSVGSGLIGAVLGIIVVEIAKNVINIPMLVTIDLLFYAFMFALLVGVVGGVYPAWKAAKLDPITAMRME